MQHLSALRGVLLKAIIVLLIGFAVCLAFAADIYQILAWPLLKVLPESSHFITTHPFEAWLTYFKTAFFTSLFLSSPFLFWLLWHFVSPGLFKKEKFFSLFFVVLLSLFFISGALFGYFVVFPVAFEYFVSLTQNTAIVFLPSMNDYLNFSFKMLLAFGIAFELPLLVMGLAMTGLVSFKKLFAFQKYMVVVAFVLSAMLTPPDVISQLLMGIPILLLYELGLLLSWMFKKSSYQHCEPKG